MSNITQSLINDNETYWISVFILLNINFSRYGMGLVWIMGNVGSIMNCCVLFQPTLRRNSCVMYLLAASISQFMTFNFSLIIRILQFGYNVQAVNTFLWFCKIRYYIFYIFVAMPRYYIILASIDRYLTSSSSIIWRRWSSSTIAKCLIIGNTLFWCLIYLQVLIFYEIQNGDCSFRNGVYGMFFSIYLFIDSGILPPSIMLIFGVLTIKNIRQATRKIAPLVGVIAIRPAQNHKISRKDLQFSKMLLNQICFWVVLNFLNPCYLLYRTLTINTQKTLLRQTFELFINNMTYFLIYLGFSLSFFVYTLSSSLFRRELNQIIRKKILHRRTIHMNVEP